MKNRKTLKKEKPKLNSKKLEKIRIKSKKRE